MRSHATREVAPVVGGYCIVIERNNGKPTGKTVERVSHTGHPRVGEEVQIGEKRYRVARVCHVDASPDDGMPEGTRYRFTAPLVYVRPARS